MHGEAEWIVDEENGTAQLEKTEVFEVQVEAALLLLLFLGCLAMLLFFALWLILFLQV